MSAIFSLMPGMESLGSRFEDDESINVEVNVNESPETIQEETEADEAMDNAAPIEATAEADEQATEVAEMYFDTLEAHLHYLKTNGYTRDFQMLANFDGRYNGILMRKGISVYGLEDISSSAYPGDATSIAAMEGIGDALSKFWEWIKNICKKIWRFITNLFSSMKMKFGALWKRIGRAREMYNDRKWDPDAKSDAKVADVGKVETTFKELKDASTAMFTNLNDVLDKLMYNLKEWTPNDKTANTYTETKNNDNTTTKTMKNSFGNSFRVDTGIVTHSKEDIKKINDKYDDLVKDCDKSKSIEDYSSNDIKKALDNATTNAKEFYKEEAKMRIIDKFTKEMDKLATKFSRMDGTASVKGGARSAVKLISGEQGVFAKVVAGHKRLAEAYLHVAVTGIVKMMKS